MPVFAAASRSLSTLSFIAITIIGIRDHGRPPDFLPCVGARLGGKVVAPGRGRFGTSSPRSNHAPRASVRRNVGCRVAGPTTAEGWVALPPPFGCRQRGSPV
ncbi:hypothetical protein ACJJTC_012801 [Scirpophaga incertulas]